MKYIITILLIVLMSACTYVNPHLTAYNQKCLAYPDSCDPKITEQVNSGVISIGMTADEVKASWWAPLDIHKTIGSWGVHEQWIYGSLTYGTRKYLYFENGILTGIQD